MKQKRWGFIPELLDEYLASPLLQFIATETPGNYHLHLERLGAFSRRFAEVLIDTPDLTATTRVLQNVALYNENKYKVMFTYAGLHSVTTMPIDLLSRERCRTKQLSF